MSPPIEAISLDFRLSSFGLALSPGKTSILLGKEATPQSLEAGLGSDLLTRRLDATICHDGHTTCTGHAVLGTSIGSDECITTFAQHSVDEAIRVRMLISELLLDRDSTGAEGTGVFSPDEHDTLLRYCVGAKVKHRLRTLPPGTAADYFHRLHSDLLDSHLNVTPPSVDHHTAQFFNLASPHFDVRSVAALPLGLGGHSFVPFSQHPPPPLATSNSSPTSLDSSDLATSHHHAAFYASWSGAWSLIRAWVPLLRNENLPSLSDLITSSSPPYPPFKIQIRDTWLKINAAPARLKLHPGRKHLPTHHCLPSYFDPFLDGENEPMPEMQSVPQTPSGSSSPNRPCLLILPNFLNYQSPDKIQSSISAFCDVYQSAFIGPHMWKQILSRLVTRINAIQYKQKDKEYGKKQKWKDSVSGTRTQR